MWQLNRISNGTLFGYVTTYILIIILLMSFTLNITVAVFNISIWNLPILANLLWTFLADKILIPATVTFVYRWWHNIGRKHHGKKS